ncbi:hypothetical protein MNBD_GAMMA03-991 [hydrothermal vent metagenome]|uniref:Mobile element protein n=1 Tax=hydrothermal vent metagenome TaxID=652676 RepID=A0A3B0VNU0_9ZZZZ
MPNDKFYAALESTGGYENNWFNKLVSFQSTLNLEVARLNPRGVKNNSNASMNRITTDKISAKNVAEYLIAHPQKVSYQHESSLATLRKQWGFIKMLSKQKTQLLNQLESLVYSANPEILVFCKNSVPQWILKLLIKYPTAKKLAKAKKSTVAKIPYIADSRAEELIAHAQKSVASFNDDIAEGLVTATVQQILHLEQSIADQVKLLEERSSVPEVELLRSFNGINSLSAIGLLMEIHDVTRFSSTKKLASFFGLHPVFKVSGDGSSGFRMSKEGRKAPRKILFMVTLTAIRSNPLIREIYLKHTKKGMSKMATIGLCMHKIIRIVYGMLKHNTKFDPKIDRKNNEKIISIKRKPRQDKNRRFQDFDPVAPISRRQGLKRKERKLAQSNNIAECGLITSALCLG